MQRNNSSLAIILSLRPLGDNNTSVTLITPSEGISYATLYGGPKSKMRSLVCQFNCGKIWLYENPEKKQTKITDFEVENYYPSFSQNLFKFYAASLATELAIKTKCAGSNEEFFSILKGLLDGMELCNEDQSRLGFIRFLWRFFILMGVQPNVFECESCSKKILDTKFEMSNISYYNKINGCFICNECAKTNINATEANHILIPLKKSALCYLDGINNLSPAQVRTLKIDEEAYIQIKQLEFYLLEKNIEQKLNTIETGMGIL